MLRVSANKKHKKGVAVGIGYSQAHIQWISPYENTRKHIHNWNFHKWKTKTLNETTQQQTNKKTPCKRTNSVHENCSQLAKIEIKGKKKQKWKEPETNGSRIKHGRHRSDSERMSE